MDQTAAVVEPAVVQVEVVRRLAAAAAAVEVMERHKGCAKGR